MKCHAGMWVAKLRVRCRCSGLRLSVVGLPRDARPHRPPTQCGLVGLLKTCDDAVYGAIVFIATFLEKFAQHPHWRSAVIVSLLGFLVAVLGALAAMTGLAMDAASTGTETYTDYVDALKVLGVSAAWLGFVVGVTALTLFALNNLPV